MGNLLSQLGVRIFKLFEKVKAKGRILFIGLDAAGKTTILYRMKLGEVVTTIPTIGFNVETFQIGKVELTCWDVGGEDRIRSLWRHYYQNTDCLIFVIDSHDLERMDEAWELFQKTYRDDEINNKPCLFMMNKSDLENRMSSIDFIERYKLYDYFRHQEWYVVDACALTGVGLFEGFELVSKTLDGNPVSQDYHCRGYTRVKEICSLGWTPELHDLFPLNFRNIVWGLILLNDRKDLSLDSIRLILSYVEVRMESFIEMKRISEFYLRNTEKFENVKCVRNKLGTSPLKNVTSQEQQHLELMGESYEGEY